MNTIEQILLSSEIQEVENEIIFAYIKSVHYHDIDLSSLQVLLKLRRDFINKKVLAHQEELLPTIIDFNEALRDSLQKIYNKALRLWNNIQQTCDEEDYPELTAKCYLGYEYPKMHPLQKKDRQKLWDALNDEDWNILYGAYGVSFETISFPIELSHNFETFIGMDDYLPNWNEGLNQELTKDLNLIHQFQNLLQHTHFAITDFIYVRDFESQINIEINHCI